MHRVKVKGLVTSSQSHLVYLVIFVLVLDNPRNIDVSSITFIYCTFISLEQLVEKSFSAVIHLDFCQSKITITTELSKSILKRLEIGASKSKHIQKSIATGQQTSRILESTSNPDNNNLVNFATIQVILKCTDDRQIDRYEKALPVAFSLSFNCRQKQHDNSF